LRLRLAAESHTKRARVMKVLYIDAFSGISGDMTVGAFLSLGLPIDRLRHALSTIDLSDYTVTADACEVSGIRAVRFRVHTVEAAHAHRPYRAIRDLLDRSRLEAVTKTHALRIFDRLAEAEGRVHGVALDDVEFHEVGAVDSIVDIVGAAVGIAAFGVERVYVSPLPLGSGLVQSQHGPLPVPGPATVELLRGFPIRPGDGDGELVTPTGAAIVASTAQPGPVPDLRIEAVGYGAGTRTLADRPNVLRLVLGEAVASPARDEQLVLETNIDDYQPEFFDLVMERLFAAGARDVYLAPVHMKKNRPGIVVSVMCAPTDRERVAGVLLSETSTIGVRYFPVQRLVLPRTVEEVQTPYGIVRVKIATGPDGHRNLAPEYDDCRRAAVEHRMPIKLVYQAALVAAAQRDLSR
jgi:uncharacterized protein (TIGR00299 family) protein